MKNQLKITSTTKNDCLIVEIDQNTNEVLLLEFEGESNETPVDFMDVDYRYSTENNVVKTVGNGIEINDNLITISIVDSDYPAGVYKGTLSSISKAPEKYFFLELQIIVNQRTVHA